MTLGCLTNLLQGCCWDKIRNLLGMVIIVWGRELAGHRLPETPDNVLQALHPQLLSRWHSGLFWACQKINEHLYLQTVPKDSSAFLDFVPDGGTPCKGRWGVLKSFPLQAVPGKSLGAVIGVIFTFLSLPKAPLQQFQGAQPCRYYSFQFHIHADILLIF